MSVPPVPPPGHAWTDADPMTAAAPKRLILLGASNLTIGLPTSVSIARRAWGESLEIFAAAGHGRSFGVRSRVLARALPGILDCGLWAELGRRPPAPTRAVVTDIGNDILYGAPAGLIAGWVDECLRRLRDAGADAVMTDLPLFNIRGLSSLGFTLFRTAYFPSCRLSLDQVTRRAEELVEALKTLAVLRGVRLSRLRPEWYGVDPIHIRRRRREDAWRDILLGGGVAAGRAGTGQALDWASRWRLRLACPRRRWILGLEQAREQPAVRLLGGATVWLY